MRMYLVPKFLDSLFAVVFVTFATLCCNSQTINRLCDHFTLRQHLYKVTVRVLNKCQPFHAASIW